MKIVYYAVVANTHPFKNQKQLFCITDKQAAEKVCDFVRSAFIHALNGGIDVSVEMYKGNVVRTAMGLRLEKMPNGAITLIHEKVTRLDIQMILNLPFYDEKLLLKETPLSQKHQIIQGTYHSVIAQVCPWTAESKIKIGYYIDSDTAQKVAAFIRDFYMEEINGGVDAYPMKYTGTLHISSKTWVEMSGQMYEVKSNISLEEYRRLANLSILK